MFVVIAVIVVNIIGFLLKYFDLNRDIVFLGFRFHLSLVLPFLIILLKKDSITDIKKFLQLPESKSKYFLTAAFVIIPVLVLTGLLFLLRLADIGDPDYFYELGMTSILDYPVYLIWNLPQLLMFTSFLLFAVHEIKYKMPVIFPLIVSLFIYEFIPVKASPFALLDAVAFIIAAVIFSLFLSKIRNVYLFSVVLFSTLWSDVLVFGCSSRVLVNFLLAKTYNQWDGFLEVKKTYYPYIMIVHFTLSFILFFIPFIVNSRQSNRSSLSEYQMENLNK